MSAPTEPTCPKCGGHEITAITLSYHSTQITKYGIEFQHQGWGESYAYACEAEDDANESCGWTSGEFNEPFGGVDADITPKEADDV